MVEFLLSFYLLINIVRYTPLILIQRFSVITLYQYYFPADGERSFGEDGEKLGRGWGKS